MYRPITGGYPIHRTPRPLGAVQLAADIQPSATPSYFPPSKVGFRCRNYAAVTRPINWNITWMSGNGVILAISKPNGVGEPHKMRKLGTIRTFLDSSTFRLIPSESVSFGGHIFAAVSSPTNRIIV